MTFFSARAINEATNELAHRDSKLGKIIADTGVLLPRARPETFESLCQIIVNQQLSGTVADRIFTRITEIGQLSDEFCPYRFLEVEHETLRACGLSGQKIGFMKGFAEIHCRNPDFFSAIEQLDDEEAYTALVKVRGIGPWTAAIFLMSCYGRLDVFPLGDATLERSIELIYGFSPRKEPQKYLSLIDKWKPYRSLAARYLWQWFDSDDRTVFQV